MPTSFQYMFFIPIIVIATLAFWDVQQIQVFHSLNDDGAWELYEEHTVPSFYLVNLFVFASLSGLAYVFSKSFKLALALFSAAFIMFVSGLEDLFFFLFGPAKLEGCFPWFDNGHVVGFWADLLGQACPNTLSLVVSVSVGLFASYWVFNKVRLWK